MPSSADVSFGRACELAGALVAGDARRAMAARYADAPTLAGALARLRDSFSAHAFEVGSRFVSIDRVEDIDVVYVAGYGFPAAKGGPMFQADEMGLVNVLRLLRDQAGGDAAQAGFWRPAPLIGILAASGRSLRHAQALDTQAFDTQEMAA